MPGKEYQAGVVSYRYSFNGQEKEKEVNENITTALYWEYDSRIGRRWNIDPVRKEYESPYLTFSGSPIWLTDHLGNDTTKYIDNNNNLLMTVGNGKKGYNRVVIVNDQSVKAVREYAEKNKAALNSKSGVKNNVEVDNYLKKYGVTYDIDAIKKFLMDNRNKKAIFLNEVDRAKGKRLSSYLELSNKGKRLSWIRSETVGGLVLKNNIVTVGGSSFFINNNMVQTAGSLSNSSEPNWVGSIHDHPFGDEEMTTLIFSLGRPPLGGTGYLFFLKGPSPNEKGTGDKSPGNAPKQGFRNALIDNNTIFLYDNSHPDIQIKYQ